MKIQSRIIMGFILTIILFQTGVVVYDFYQKQKRIKVLKEILDSYSVPVDSLFLWDPQIGKDIPSDEESFGTRDKPLLFI